MKYIVARKIRIPYDAPCPFEHLGENIDVNLLTPDDKEWLGAQLFYEKMTSVALAKKYGIKERLLRKYKATVSECKSFRESGGRPCVVDKIGKNNIRNLCTGNEFQVTTDEVNNYILHEAVETAKRRGEQCTLYVDVSRRTKNRILEDTGLKKTKAEEATDARIQACSCFRNLFTFITANSIMTSITKPNLILNMDATQFCVGGGTEKVEVVVPKGKHSNLKCKAQKLNYGTTHYFVKYYLILTAAGMAAPPIFLLADAKMNHHDCDVHMLEGLGCSTNPKENLSYVVYTKTRCANAAFYKWIIEDIIVQFVADIRRALPEKWKNQAAWFQLDGEWTQIKEFLDEQTHEKMTEHNIVVGKLPGSTTEIYQPADQTPFKNAKKRLTRIHDVSVRGREIERELLNDLIKSHELKCSTKVNPRHKQFMVNGLLRVENTLRQTTNSANLEKSFEDTGIYPFDMNKMMANCKIRIPDEERAHWNQQLPLAKDLLLQHGELSDKILDDLNIANNMETNKDNLIIPRRRMILLTNKGFLLREGEKQMEKLRVEQAKVASAADRKLRVEKAKVSATEKKNAKQNKVVFQTPERAKPKRKQSDLQGRTISPAQETAKVFKKQKQAIEGIFTTSVNQELVGNTIQSAFDEQIEVNDDSRSEREELEFIQENVNEVYEI
jgi:hypothetical protein